MRLPVGVVVCALAQCACDLAPTKAAPAATAKPTPQRPPLHRFVLTRVPNDSSVAFDTQTGQICRTWGWQPVGTDAKPDRITGNVPQRLIGEFTPACLSLYEKYPSGPGDGVQNNESASPDSK